MHLLQVQVQASVANDEQYSQCYSDDGYQNELVSTTLENSRTMVLNAIRFPVFSRSMILTFYNSDPCCQFGPFRYADIPERRRKDGSNLA